MNKSENSSTDGARAIEYDWKKYEELEEKIIWPWQRAWYRQSDYQHRAMSVDANMKYDLGKYIYEYVELLKSEITKLKEELERLKK